MTVAEQIVQAKEDYDAVYDAGKKVGREEMWNALQANGTRTDYEYGFMGWAEEYIRPLHKVVPTARSIGMFSYNTILKKVESQYFDLSNGKIENSQTGGHYRTFSECVSLEEVEDIGMKAAYYYATFYRCMALKKIAVVRSNEDSVFNTTFFRCYALENITFEGVIANNIDFKDCKKLTLGSLINTLRQLKDFTGTGEEYTRTLTLSQESFDILNEDTISWISSMLQGEKKWNLTVV